MFKAFLTVPKVRAAEISALLELTPPLPQAVLRVEDPFAPDTVVEALYDTPPDAEFLTRLTGFTVSSEALPDQDWIRMSQEGLPPVRAGRFFVYGAHDGAHVPPGVLPLHIEAGLAFGTGHHETTALCLLALSDLAKTRRFAKILDLGCGTGVLALAAAKLWRKPVLATDIDPIAVEVTRANARLNNEAPRILAVTAEGMDSPAIGTRAPYDLILANILASPLTQLAPAIGRAAARGGLLVLSGLLRWQENLVLSFYRAQGFRFLRAYRSGNWTALVLEKPRGKSDRMRDRQKTP